MPTQSHPTKKQRHSDLDAVQNSEASSNRSSESIDRGYGDEHGGYVVKPVDGDPRRPADVPDDPDLDSASSAKSAAKRGK